jgi:hypothetical protein
MSKHRLVLILSGGAFGGAENTILKFCSKHNIKSVLSIDNWDNLSSKSIFSIKPDLTLVWGEEMLDDAVRIQKFEPKRIELIGSSRTDIWDTEESETDESEREFIYFVCSGKQWTDESKFIHELSRVLLEQLPKTRILVRPHPFYTVGGGNQAFISSLGNLKNVDLELLTSQDDFYSLNTLVTIEKNLRRSRFVVGSHSTMLVEALYYGKRVIALSSSDSEIFKDGDAWGGYCHMLQIRGNPGVLEIKSLNELQFALGQTIESTKNQKGESNFVPKILPNFAIKYPERLLRALEKALT